MNKEGRERTLNPGDIVVIDNLGPHKSHAVRSAIRAAGARLLRRAGALLDLFPPDECQNYLTNTGYATV